MAILAVNHIFSVTRDSAPKHDVNTRLRMGELILLHHRRQKVSGPRKSDFTVMTEVEIPLYKKYLGRV